MTDNHALVDVQNLGKRFPVGNRLLGRHAEVRAAEGISFRIARGELLALVGESGSGKSTVGRMLLRLMEPSAGRVVFDGTDLSTLSRRQLRAFRKRMQMIFQDPFASLNPHMRVRDMLQEALAIHGIGSGRVERAARIAALLESVGLSPEFAGRFPHEFSGGQRQRLVIARALAVNPEFIVADEAISALDVSNQAQVMNLLLDLKERDGLTLLFISHNLAVVKNIADSVAVMYLGRLMELSPAEHLFGRPAHPYTAALLAAVPVPEPGAAAGRIVLQGDIPSPIAPPTGCVFRTRCPHAAPRCASEVPALRSIGDGRQVACIRYEEIHGMLLASPAGRTTASGRTAGAAERAF